MCIWISILARLDLRGDPGRLILCVMGMILTFNMGRDVTLFVLYPFVLGYMIAYMPTLALVNSVAFAQMKDPSKQFGKIRVWGTIGWIVAGLAISYLFAWDAKEAIAQGMLGWSCGRSQLAGPEWG